MSKNKIASQLEARGVSEAQIASQIERFKRGFDFLDITEPATPSNCIEVLSDAKIQEYISYYDSKLQEIQITKFIPASGAASRMFKKLFEFVQGNEEIEIEQGKEYPFFSIENFIGSLKKFAFYSHLQKTAESSGLSLEELLKNKQYKKIVSLVLDKSGLSYGTLPKGLLIFHNYPNKSRTAIEEHFVEGALYATDKDRIVDLHFTISPEHINLFKEHVAQIKNIYEEKFNVRYNVSYSVQDIKTDTIAVGSDNVPILKDDEYIFRPGGHGALIYNLDKIMSNLVFIKNIDNVVPDSFKEDTITYKKALGGILLKTQSKIYSLIEALIKGNSIDEATEFLANTLKFKVASQFTSLGIKEKIDYLISALNRPIRVCGMVRNEGEPGGGPFLVRNATGEISPQIVEKAQIDENDESQAKFIKESTHFNPVDLVCGVYNYKGEKFNLLEFVDDDAGIITEKSKDGVTLKALELPGLWNGAMANWNTIFVEVPISTFNPVKEVNDLLRKEHQV